MSAGIAAMAAASQGAWMRAEELDLTVDGYNSRFGWKYRCEVCMVTWNEPAGRLTACWVCGKMDDTVVWAFNGKPWSYTLKPNAGALLGPPAGARDHNNERGGP